MTLRFQCPRCETPQSQEIGPAQHEIRCPNCDWSRAVTAEKIAVASPSCCVVCGTRDLWRQKDFPQSIGLTMVAAGAVFSSIAWYYHRPVWALGILLAFAAVDLLLYAFMPDVLVCYRCRARHSGGDLSEHPAFDHETAERYRQEQLRLEEAASTQRASCSDG
ncbi:MAG: hypothetical protein AB7U20_03165 [Planctomycetaceae bacterium]